MLFQPQIGKRILDAMDFGIEDHQKLVDREMLSPTVSKVRSPCDHIEDRLALVQKCEEYLVKDNSYRGVKKKIKIRQPLKTLVGMEKDREAYGILLVCSSAMRTSQRKARRNNLAVSELFCDVALTSSSESSAADQKLTKDTQLEMKGGGRRQESLLQTNRYWTRFVVLHGGSVLKKFYALGLEMKPLVTDDSWSNLAQTSTDFCRHFPTTTESCAYLAKYGSLKRMRK